MTPDNYNATNNAYPQLQGCTGGSATACGSIALAVSQATACSGGLVCTYTDSSIGGSSTSSYTGQRTLIMPVSLISGRDV